MVKKETSAVTSEKETTEIPEATETKRKVKQKLDDNLLVTIKSNVKGKLIYKSKRSGQEWRFTDIGDEDTIELSELRTMLSSNRAFLEKGWIIVMDEEIVEYLNLKRLQKNVLDADDVEFILKLDPPQILESIKEASTNTKSLLFSFAQEKFVNGELNDYRVIKAIEDGLGQKLDPNN